MLNNCKETKLQAHISFKGWLEGALPCSSGSHTPASQPPTHLPTWWASLLTEGAGSGLWKCPETGSGHMHTCIHARLLRNLIQMTLLWGNANSSNVALYQRLPTSLTRFTIGYSIGSKISYTSRQIHTWTYCTLSLWLSIITSKTWSLIMNLIHRSQGALWNYKNSTLTRPSEITVEEWMNYSEAQSQMIWDYSL